MDKHVASSKEISNYNEANLGFEAKLLLIANKIRNNMDAAEYKHVVVGLIFLKYISDSGDEMHERLLAAQDDGADSDDAEEYRAENVFWMPKEGHWPHLKGKAKQPTTEKMSDDAMVMIESDNPHHRGILLKDYACPSLDKHQLGKLINLDSTIGLGHAENRSIDIMERVYEYFLSQFASAGVRRAASSLLLVARSECWLKCSLRTRTECTFRAAARVPCSCRAKSSSRPTAGGSRVRTRHKSIHQTSKVHLLGDVLPAARYRLGLPFVRRITLECKNWTAKVDATVI